MITTLSELLERFVVATERQATATERLAAMAEERGLEPQVEPVAESDPVPDTTPDVPKELMEAKALIHAARWSPMDVLAGECKYTAKTNNLLRDLLNLRFVEFNSKATGKELHVLVKASYPELVTVLEPAEEEPPIPEEEPTEKTADTEEEKTEEGISFPDFKKRILDFVGSDKERRDQVTQLIAFFGAANASDLPADRRYEFLAKLGVE